MPKNTESDRKRFFKAMVLILLTALLHGAWSGSSEAEMPNTESVEAKQETVVPIPESNGESVNEIPEKPSYADVTIGGTRNADALISMAKENAEEQTPLPDYVLMEADEAAGRINSHWNEGNIVFPFLSDAHCGYYTDENNTAAALAGQLMNQIGKQVNYSFIANGGDMSTGAWNTTRDLTFSHVEDYANLLRFYDENVPAVWAMGNHDDAPYQQTQDRVSQIETYSLVGMRNARNGVQGPEGCNYGYLDLTDLKLRVIVLDTDDKRELGSVSVGAGQPGPEYLNAHNIGAGQLRWLADVALDFSEMEHPGEWSVVVISHVALNVSGWTTDAVSGKGFTHSTANAAAILAAYRNGGRYRVNHNGETVSCDFSDIDERAEIICAVHGHEHRFGDEMVSGILSVGCPNIMNGRERKSDDGNTYAKTPDSSEGTSFCVITIDRENRKIYADCVGAGYDREFSY